MLVRRYGKGGFRSAGDTLLWLLCLEIPQRVWLVLGEPNPDGAILRARGECMAVGRKAHAMHGPVVRAMRLHLLAGEEIVEPDVEIRTPRHQVLLVGTDVGRGRGVR